jgi:hypothetical protein
MRSRNGNTAPQQVALSLRSNSDTAEFTPIQQRGVVGDLSTSWL